MKWSVYCSRCHCSYRYDDDADAVVAVVAVVALIRKLDLWIENSYNKIAYWYLLYKTSTREKAAINKNNNQQQQQQKLQNQQKPKQKQMNSSNKWKNQIQSSHCAQRTQKRIRATNNKQARNKPEWKQSC